MIRIVAEIVGSYTVAESKILSTNIAQAVGLCVTDDSMSRCYVLMFAMKIEMRESK